MQGARNPMLGKRMKGYCKSCVIECTDNSVYRCLVCQPNAPTLYVECAISLFIFSLQPNNRKSYKQN